jgi:hypothetical protein
VHPDRGQALAGVAAAQFAADVAVHLLEGDLAAGIPGGNGQQVRQAAGPVRRQPGQRISLVPVRDQPVSQPAPCLEHRLVDGTPGRAELQGQHVDRHPAEQDGPEHHPLLLGQVLLDAAAQRPEYPVPARRHPGQPLRPLPAGRGQRARPPLQLGDLRGNFGHHELGRPDGERCGAALTEIGNDRGQRGRRGLLGQRTGLGPGGHLVLPAVQLRARGLQQQILQPGRRLPGLLPRRAEFIRPRPCVHIHRASPSRAQG